LCSLALGFWPESSISSGRAMSACSMPWCTISPCPRFSSWSSPRLRILGKSSDLCSRVEAPLFLLVLLLGLLRLLRLSRENFYLFSVSTVFGSLAFFWDSICRVRRGRGGGPEARGAFRGPSCSIRRGVCAYVTRTPPQPEGPWVRAVGKTLRRLARNPLILSILMGLALGIGKVELPPLLSADSAISQRDCGSACPLFLGGLSFWPALQSHSQSPWIEPFAVGNSSRPHFGFCPRSWAFFPRDDDSRHHERDAPSGEHDGPFSALRVLCGGDSLPALVSSLGSLLTLSLWQLVI